MKHSNVLIYFAIIFFTSIGPIFNYLPIKLVFVLFALFIYIVVYRPISKTREHLILYFLIIVFLITTAITCIVNETVIPVIFSLTFSITLFCALQIRYTEIHKLVEILTTVFKYVIILAWVGYFYSLFSEPLFSLINPNGVSNHFYLTTFSISNPPIRPSGFYDEPGAFSFFICLLVFLRTYLGFNLRTSMFLMIGGLITQSLAHAVFLLLWVVSILITNEIKVKFSFFKRIITAIIFFTAVFIIWKSGILDWAIDRTLSWSQDQESVVRVKNYNNVYYEIQGNYNNLLFGFDKNVVNRSYSQGYSENVLTPIAYGGLFASWPFYLFLGFCLIYPFLTFNNFSLVAVGLLIMLRPYFLELPYSFCLAIIIALYISVKIKEKFSISPANKLHLNSKNNHAK